MSKKKTGKGLTTPGMLVEKMRKRGKRSSRRMRAAKGMVVAGSAAAGIGMRLPGLSIAGQGITLAAWDAAQSHMLRRKLIKHPKATRMLAARFRGTDYGPFLKGRLQLLKAGQ